MILDGKTLCEITKYTRANGGGTFSMPDGTPVTEGYAVARPDMVGGHEIKGDNVIDAIRDLLAESHNWRTDVEIIGTWISDGQCYAEITSVITDRDAAIALGTRLGQEEIYNLTTGERIPLKVAPIMRSRVIVSSYSGYGYGDTVEEAKLNHDRHNNMSRPITVQALPTGAKWIRDDYGQVYCPSAKSYYEETTTIDDIIALTLYRIESNARADIDHLIRAGEISNDEELNEHADEIPTYISDALDGLTLHQLFELAQRYAGELSMTTIYPYRGGTTATVCVIQALTDVLGWGEDPRNAYERGAQAVVAELLDEWELTDLEVGADRVEAIINAMEDEND